MRALAPARTLGCRRTDKTYARAPCRALLGQVYILGPTTGARRRARLCRRRSCRPVIYSPRDLRCVRPTASFLPGIPPICWTRSLRLTFFLSVCFILVEHLFPRFISFSSAFQSLQEFGEDRGLKSSPPTNCRRFLSIVALFCVFARLPQSSLLDRCGKKEERRNWIFYFRQVPRRRLRRSTLYAGRLTGACSFHGERDKKRSRFSGRANRESRFVTDVL